VRQDVYQWEGEPPHACDLVLHPGAVAILPIAADGRLLLIRQWRRAVGEILIEIPAGILEKGEEAAACANRELQEETGFRAKTLVPIGSLYTAPGFCNEKIHLYLASDLEESPLPPDAHEAIDLHTVSLEEALDLIETNRIIDAKTIAAVLRYARRHSISRGLGGVS
jgi:ADP-ribose pyrophosphatase